MSPFKFIPASRKPAGALCVDPALLDGESHAINRQHVGGDAVVHVVGLGVAHHVLEAVAQDRFQLLVHDRFLPEVSLAVLHPLKVAGGYAAGIGQDVGHDEDALLGKDLVGHGGGGPVGALHHDARLDLVGVAAGDHVLCRRGNQDLAVGQQQLLAGHGFCAAEAKNRIIAVLVLEQLVNIDAGGVVQAAVALGDAHDLVALLLHQARGIRSHIAESLDHDTAALDGACSGSAGSRCTPPSLRGR